MASDPLMVASSPRTEEYLLPATPDRATEKTLRRGSQVRCLVTDATGTQPNR